MADGKLRFPIFLLVGTIFGALLMEFGVAEWLHGQGHNKHIIGATAEIYETDSKFPFNARIDTGAHTCSIDAYNISIEGEVGSAEANVGKTVHYLLKNRTGKSRAMTSKIVNVTAVETADSNKQSRYEVELTLDWKGVKKQVLVTLNDRSDLDYSLLIGRNFLIDDFVVDVSRDADDR